MAVLDPGTLSDDEFEAALARGDSFEESNSEEPQIETEESPTQAVEEVPQEQVEDTPASDEPTEEDTEEVPNESKVDNTSVGPKEDATAVDNDPAASTTTTENTTVDYEQEYKKVFAPFKASGKLITVKTPEEAISLMQKGVHFNSEMQKLAPQKRIIAMLQNHGLLDESKLSELVSLSKKDPAAIKQLVKDSGIDPLDIDTIPDRVAPVSYAVTDQQVQWTAALEDLKSSEGGSSTLNEISNTWDDFSIESLAANPELLHTFHEQRQNGIYQTITAEMDRMRAVGQLPATVPFLQGYKTVGDQLHAAGAFSSLVPATKNSSPQPRKVVGSKPASVPTAVSDTRAKAAAATRTTSARSGSQQIDYGALSDEEFLKQF